MPLSIGLNAEAFEGGANGSPITVSNTIYDDITTADAGEAQFLSNPAGGGLVATYDNPSPTFRGARLAVDVPPLGPPPPGMTAEVAMDDFWEIYGDLYSGLGYTKQDLYDALLAGVGGDEGALLDQLAALIPKYHSRITRTESWHYLQDDYSPVFGAGSDGINLPLTELPGGAGASLSVQFAGAIPYLRAGGSNLIPAPRNEWFRVLVSHPEIDDDVQVTVYSAGGATLTSFVAASALSLVSTAAQHAYGAETSAPGNPLIYLRTLLDQVEIEVVPGTWSTAPPAPAVRLYPRDDARAMSSAPRQWPPVKNTRIIGGMP